MWKFSWALSQLIVTNELLLVENDAEKQKVIRLIGFLCVFARRSVYMLRRVSPSLEIYVPRDGSIYFLLVLVHSVVIVILLFPSFLSLSLAPLFIKFVFNLPRWKIKITPEVNEWKTTVEKVSTGKNRTHIQTGREERESGRGRERDREWKRIYPSIRKSKLKNHTPFKRYRGETVFISIIINTSLTNAIVLKSHGLILPLIRYKNNYDPLIS